MLIYICEDTKSDSLRLQHHLETFSSEIQAKFNIESFSSADALLQKWDTLTEFPVLVFLDIYMENINGMEIAKLLRSKYYTGGIIFTTSSTEHAMQSYEVNALYYLHKPYTHENFLNAMDRCRSLLEDAMLQFSCSSKGKAYDIPLSNILYFETGNHNIIVHTKNEEIVISRSMNSIVDEFNNVPCFISCGKSFFVNLNHITQNTGTDLIICDGSYLPIPVRTRSEITSKYNDWKKKMN